jgi:hypothetical protein
MYYCEKWIEFLEINLHLNGIACNLNWIELNWIQIHCSIELNSNSTKFNCNSTQQLD